MKYKILAFLFFSLMQLKGQIEFVSFPNCKKSTEYIAIENPEQLSKFIKKVSKYSHCTALKVDTRLMTQSAISEFISFLATQPAINTLELRYLNNDSIDFNTLAELTEIENLGLQNSACNYPGKEQLSGLKKLYKISIYVEHLEQIPISICQLNTLGELELLSEKTPTNQPSYLYLNYALNDSLDNAIEINSYCENIDLSIDSMKNLFFALCPQAQERKSQVFNSFPNRSMFETPEPTAYYKPIAALQPIDKNAPISFESQSINNMVDNQLIFKDQTVLNIPSDAFISPSGKLIEGDVKILYRAIRTPLEIMESGITMFYDTAGQRELFKTNGMFEVRAFANGEALKLADNKSIGIDFGAKKDSSNFNLYALNDKNGKWQYKAPIRAPKNNRSKFNYYIIKDRTEFAQRYDNLTYTNVLPPNIYASVAVPYLSLKKVHANSYFKFNSGAHNSKKIREGRTLLRLKIDYENSDRKTKKLRFYLFNPFIKDKANPIFLFPELRPFNDFLFEYDGEILTSEFSNQFKKGKVYNDIRIYYENNAESATIELKTKTGFIQIPVKAVITNVYGKKRPNNSFKRAYRKYVQLLSIKEIKFNQTLNKTISRNEKSDTNLYFKYWAYMGNGINTNSYQLNIDLLGFFNCDQLYRIKNPIQMVASRFKCSEHFLDSMVSVYVVDKDANGTYNFNPSTIILSYENVGGLVFQNQRGEIYTCTGESLRSQINPVQQQQNGTVINLEKMPLKKAENMVRGIKL